MVQLRFFPIRVPGADRTNFRNKKQDRSNTCQIDVSEIEQITAYKYVGHEVYKDHDIQITVIHKKLVLAWTVFGNDVLMSKIPIKIFNECFLPVMTDI